MLTVDLLAGNHRLIYEAVRDAVKPVSPKEIEELSGIPGTTLRPTLGVMLEKGLLQRPIYGVYTVVPLDEVLVGGETPQARSGHAVSPTTESSEASIAGDWSPAYREFVGQKHVVTVTINPEDDVESIGSWVRQMLDDADEVVMQSEDVTMAKNAKKDGKPIRWRLVLEVKNERPAKNKS